jgi:parallel beta-helix repeat protein
MRILVNRISSATVLALILAIASTIIISSPTAMALTIDTTVTADANPNPVRVGNEILLEININPDLPSGYYYQDVVITVTGPDATVSNLGPFSTDQFGQLFYFFVPTLVGTYSLNFSYPGEILNGNTYTSCEVGPIFVDSVPDLFRVHNLDTDLNYTSIQSAIDAPETLTGHTIFVDNGTYHESVEITKSITLMGEDSGNTIIDGDGRPATVVYAQGVNGVEISGFTIKNGYNGIHLTDCPYSNVYGNTLINNTYSGIFVNDSFNCSISRNNITNSDEAIALVYSSNNFITQNRVANNQLGLSLNASTDNSIFHNSIVENVAQVSITDSFNTWDDGYPSGGNYWSDYNGIDADSDGIGDTPYFIDENNQDNYPLTKPFGIID